MRRRVPILLYHSISAEAAPLYKPWALPPEVFAAHMACLRVEGYTPITMSEFSRARAERGVRLPVRPVVLTFDDGLADFYTGAWPVLVRYGFPATLYVVTGQVGGTSRWLQPAGEGERPLLSWPQLVEVAAAGIECGAHSQTHRRLDLLPVAEARAEIAASKTTLEQRLGRPVTSFAYPYGRYSPAVRRIVQQAGYATACAVKHGLSTTADNPFALARILIGADTTVAALADRIGGRGLTAAPNFQTEFWQRVGRLKRRLGVARDSD